MRWLFVLALTGCSAIPAGAPADLQSCPGATADPAPPPAVRTVEQLGKYTIGLVAALRAEHAARAECERRLDLLNDWLKGRR